MRTRRGFMKAAAAGGAALMLPGYSSAAEIRRIEGSVRVGRELADETTIIKPNDSIYVGHGGSLAITVDDDGYLLRGGTSLVYDYSGAAAILRLLTGRLLGVFGGQRERKLVTATITIGIRGTGLYLDTAQPKTYFCTCYGKTTLNAGDGPHDVEAQRHNANFVEVGPGGAMVMEAAEVVGHTDDELRVLEGYFGRRPLFDL